MEEDYKNIHGEERKYNLLGHRAALEIALLDMSKDINIKSKYRDILCCSVKKQLMYLNNPVIYDIEIFGDNPKFIPVPPRPSYYYCPNKTRKESVVKLKIDGFINDIYMTIPRTVFRLIADVGIIININPCGGFSVGMNDFIEKEIPKYLKLKYSEENITEFIEIQKKCVSDKYRQEKYINKQTAEEELNRHYKQEEQPKQYVSRYKPNYKNKNIKEEEETKQEKEPSFEDFLKFFNSFGHFKAKL